MPPVPQPITLEYVQTVFGTPLYQKLRQDVTALVQKTPNALIREDGTYNEVDWVPFEQPLPLSAGDWRVSLYRDFCDFTYEGKTISITFLRMTPPETCQDGLAADPAGSAWKKASDRYRADLLSPPFTRFTIGLIDLLHDQVYKDQPVLFFPMKDLFGLLPAYKYNALIPYVDLISLSTD